VSGDLAGGDTMSTVVATVFWSVVVIIFMGTLFFYMLKLSLIRKSQLSSHRSIWYFLNLKEYIVNTVVRSIFIMYPRHNI